MSLTDNLISFWELEESSGTRYDAHGNHDLVDNNTVGQATGKVGYCADLYSSNSEYLSYPSTPELATGDIDFSIAAWVNLRSTGGSPRIAAKGRWSTQREWGVYYSGLRFIFYISADGENVYDVVEAYDFGAISLNTWYFVVAWHDASADTLNIQINNGTVDSHATGGDAPAQRIGLFSIGSEYGYGLFNGLVDQLGFWKRTLTAEERTRLYNDGAGLAYDSLDFPKPPAEVLKTVVLTPSIGLYDTDQAESEGAGYLSDYKGKELVMTDESSVWVIESPVTMIEGEAVAYSIDWQGASNVNNSTISLTVYKNGEDISNTVVDDEDDFVVNSNVLTLKKITAQSTDGGERYVVVVQADVDGNTERRKLLIRIVKDEAEQ